MFPPVDLSSLSVPQRRFFGREIVGILEAVAATLILLALVSAAADPPWAGSVGAALASALRLVLGRYVAYVVPGILALDALLALVGAPPLAGRMRSGARAAGAALLLVSICALFTIHMNLRTAGEREAMFEAGGIVGGFLIDPRGLNAPRYLGTAGALVTFYGLAILGLVLFTERLVREMGRFLLRPLRWLLPEFRPRVPAWLAGAGRALGSALSLRPLRGFLARIEFRRERPFGRVISSAPIGELRLLELDEVNGRLIEDDREEDDEEGEGLAGRRDEDVPRRAGAEGEQWEGTRRGTPGGANFGAIEGAKLERRPPSIQPELGLFPSAYQIPCLDLLADPPPTNYRMSEEEAQSLSRRIEETLAQFKIAVEVTEVIQGPVVTRFALRVAPGIRVSRILALENDMAMALRAQQVRILAPIPGQAAVGVEVPNKRTNPVMLKELLASEEFQRSRAPLAFALGKNISGEAVIADLAMMPHVLIAGATGSGKSVCINGIISSLLFRNPPDRIKMVMIDPKRVELSMYQGIPHLLVPVVTEPRKAASALAWVVQQMDLRARMLEGVGVRHLEGYNALVRAQDARRRGAAGEFPFLPQIVVVIDELADLMIISRNEVEEYVIRLAQMGRAVGIHLIVATQRPSVNVITGIIKANFPTRIAFRVSSKVDSRTILDANGAEALLGRGDMLYSPGGGKPLRLQGAFVSDAEVEALADRIRAQATARYAKEDFDLQPTSAQRAREQLLAAALGPGANAQDDETRGEEDSPAEPGLEWATAGRVSAAPLPPADMESLSDEDLYAIALRLVLETRKASVSYIQRRLKIGYARAGRLMDMMEERGIVGPYQGSKPRDLIVDAAEMLRRLREDEA